MWFCSCYSLAARELELWDELSLGRMDWGWSPGVHLAAQTLARKANFHSAEDEADLSGIYMSNLFRSGASQEPCSLPVFENVTGII